MIIEDIFKEFAEIVNVDQNYQISLIDKTGTVHISTIKELEGLKMEKMKNTNQVCFFNLQVGGVDYGKLMINSTSSDLNMIAPILYDSLVTRIRFEIQQNTIVNKMSNGDNLIRLLTSQQELDMGRVKELCSMMQMRLDTPRVAILLTDNKHFTSDELNMLNLMPGEEGTFYSRMSTHHVLIYKSIGDMQSMQDIEFAVNAYIHELNNVGICGRFYVSSPVYKIQHYGKAYEDCQWLEYRLRSDEKVLFFSEHMYEYIFSRISDEDILPLVNMEFLKYENIDVKEMIEIARQMVASDFSINQTAQSLFIHKNTLLYKLKKYEIALNLNITGSTKGRVIFASIAMALEDRNRKDSMGYDL